MVPIMNPIASAPPMVQKGVLPTGVMLPPRAAKEEGNRQESDLLELCTQAENCCDALTSKVRLVSLGCYCGPKLSFQKMGRGAESLPFDWLRCRMEAVFHFLRTDFSGFFDYVTKLPARPGHEMTIFRGAHHAFWHDDPTDPGMHERYNRRIVRFKEINASSQRGGGPVLFVRVAGHTRELEQLPELLQELHSRFGDLARLLLILNFQRANLGPALVTGHERLMVWLLSEDAHKRTSASFGQPYTEPVRGALEWAVGRPVQAGEYQSLEALSKFVRPNEWGESGLGNMPAFEAKLQLHGFTL